MHPSAVVGLLGLLVCAPLYAHAEQIAEGNVEESADFIRSDEQPDSEPDERDQSRADEDGATFSSEDAPDSQTVESPGPSTGSNVLNLATTLIFTGFLVEFAIPDVRLEWDDTRDSRHANLSWPVPLMLASTYNNRPHWNVALEVFGEPQYIPKFREWRGVFGTRVPIFLPIHTGIVVESGVVVQPGPTVPMIGGGLAIGETFLHFAPTVRRVFGAAPRTDIVLNLHLTIPIHLLL